MGQGKVGREEDGWPRPGREARMAEEAPTRSDPFLSYEITHGLYEPQKGSQCNWRTFLVASRSSGEARPHLPAHPCSVASLVRIGLLIY